MVAKEKKQSIAGEIIQVYYFLWFELIIYEFFLTLKT